MRSGYSDDLDQRDLAMWRGRVASAMRGNRGQDLLREALAALDAMPDKRLVPNELVTPDGSVCLLGAVGRKRGVPDLDKINPHEHDLLAERFNVAPCLIQEIEYVNDEQGWYAQEGRETPEQRFERMRTWLLKHIKPDAAAAV